MATAPRRDWDPGQAGGGERVAPRAPGARRGMPLPKPTMAMQAHENLELDKDSGKTIMVEGVTEGRGPGFYCEVCKKMCKDSVGYLDHINGRMHLRRIGQRTEAERATVEQVRERIEAIRAERALGATATERYNFDERLKQIAAEQRHERVERRRDRREERLRKKQKQAHNEPVAEDDTALMVAMGFASFGSTRG